MRGILWITGAAGWSAMHLINYLRSLAIKPRLIGLDRAESPPPGLDAYYQVDLCQPQPIARLSETESPAWIIHLAGAMPPSSEEQMWQTNVGGTVGLLLGLATGAAMEARVLSVGSAAEYAPSTGGAIAENHPGGGVSAYGRSKWAQTLLAFSMARDLRLNVTVARSFNLIGPGQSNRLVAGALCEQFALASDGSRISVGNTSSCRDFLDIRDAVAAYWLLASSGKTGEVYNVCSGVPSKVEELVCLFKEASGKNVTVQTDQMLIHEGDVPISYGTFDKLFRATGWVPRIPLRQSVTDMLIYATQRLNA
ncbi:MAG: NAD-dependent epimerase/dehydratase family protein [Kiritimatiellia bacterium]